MRNEGIDDDGANIKAEMMWVTPEMAHAWLGNPMPGNRDLPLRDELKYAEDMKSGLWDPNGEPIIIGISGRLLNGHHRMAALIRADVPVLMLVVRGVRDETYRTMDSGRARSAAQVLKWLGYAYAYDLAALARTQLLYEDTGAPANSGRYAPSNQQVILRVKRDSERLVEAVRGSKRTSDEFSGGCIWSFCWLLFGDLEPEDRDYFFERLADGQGLREGDPILTLRNAFINARMHHRSMPRGWMGGMIIKAWNRFRNHEKLDRLSFSGKEDFPSPI